jgi:hypothetical protein
MDLTLTPTEHEFRDQLRAKLEELTRPAAPRPIGMGTLVERPHAGVSVSL